MTYEKPVTREKPVTCENPTTYENPAPAGLAAARVAHEAGGRLIVDGITLAPRPGTTLGLLGPNGSGKSTLLRLLAGVLAPAAGVVTLDGTPLPRLGRRETARRLAVVDQHATTQVELTVREVVALGRIPHRRPWSGTTPADDRAVRDALDRTDLTDRADQSWHTLSGGERQRAHIARALAQAPRELLLDEPTNHLDIQHQLDLLNLIAALPVTTVIALHDLNLAAMFCDEILVLKEGRAYAHGTPSEVVTEGLIAEVYGVRARVMPPADPDDPLDHPSVRFLRARPC
ncbi:ABC transporter ATP-binding protein [Streptomyces flavofungini]|uniref:ABC transporter ATP-binding protein n=1 Tax=Streptomyces flavofungini TaxID=68200 RepID=A0ABS0XEJ1_9ACTN|nr:ABC transporter ATP-binding protein [Streptomyces flavofungini]MBJ3811324.1 ABC transporter ATP-binding protein [Streptomyces flavofungini]GHC66148.1 sugar ABC transporter substrate-binding protein [Streptomyces flavofungini]